MYVNRSNNKLDWNSLDRLDRRLFEQNVRSPWNVEIRYIHLFVVQNFPVSGDKAYDRIQVKLFWSFFILKIVTKIYISYWILMVLEFTKKYF